LFNIFNKRLLNILALILEDTQALFDYSDLFTELLEHVLVRDFYELTVLAELPFIDWHLFLLGNVFVTI
jgi:hypothetical protein